MKRKLVLLLTLFMMFPIFANGEQAGTEGPFHFPWGIEQTDTLYTAAEKAKIGTGWEFSQFISPDGKQLHGYSASLEGKTLMDVAVNYVHIASSSTSTLDDKQAMWASIRIDFDENADLPASFAEVYRSLCSSYGATDYQNFYFSEVTLDGVQHVDKEFPISGESVSDEFTQIINSHNDFVVSAKWYNVNLQLARFSNSSSFSLSFSSKKPLYLR